MNLTEKASYIKGLADGLALDDATKEGKILKALLELVDEMAHEIEDLQADVAEIDGDIEELNQYAEELDNDLNDVEDCLDVLTDDGEEDEEEDEEDDEDVCDGDCENCDGCDDGDYYEVVCPSCGETVCFDESLDPENLVCPACGEKFGCIVEEDDYKQIGQDESESSEENS